MSFCRDQIGSCCLAGKSFCFFEIGEFDWGRDSPSLFLFRFAGEGAAPVAIAAKQKEIVDDVEMVFAKPKS